MYSSMRISSALRGSSARVSQRFLSSSSTRHALSKFAMPAMSPTMTDGGISSWKKKEGDTFTAGDVLLEIETDKATMDVEAQDDGILAKIIVQDGSKGVQVGKAIAIFAEEGDDITGSEVDKLVASAETEEPSQSSSEKETKQEQPQETKSETSAPSKPAPKSEPSPKSGPRDHIFVSPLARRLAQEKGIPLAEIKGSGPSGRIIKADIESYKPSAARPAAQAAGASASAAYTDIPLSNMRKTIAARLTESKVSTPHYYVTSEIKIDRVLKLRQVFNQAAQGADATKEGIKPGTKLSVNDFILKAVSIANAEVPEANSAWHGEFIRQYQTSDISIAVSTPTGLITPIINNVGSKGLAAISAESKALAAKARDGKLQPSEYQGGSFTVSNMGMFNSVSHFTAIVNPPQSCILAVGTTEPKVIKDEEASAVAGEAKFKEINVLKVTMSADHRVVDGAIAARWLVAFKAALENPLSFML